MADFIDIRENQEDKVVPEDSTTLPFSINDSQFIDIRESLINKPKFIDIREPLVKKPNVISPTTNTDIPVVSNNQIQPQPKVDLNLTEDMLRTDPQWIKDAKTIYKERTGKPFFGTDKEAANWLLDDQSWMGWNFTSMGKRAYESYGWDENTSQAYLRTLNTYPESKTTLRSVLSAIGYSLADLPTLGSLGWSLIAKAIGGKPAQLAMRYSFKEQLKKRIIAEALKKGMTKEVAEEVARRSGKGLFTKNAKKQLTKIRRDVAYKTGLKNIEIFAPLGFAYAGLFDLGTQTIRKNVDPAIDDIDYIDSLISGGLGATIGIPIAMIAPQVAGRFGRSKFFKESLEEDIIHGQSVPDNATSLDYLDTKQIKDLAKTANLKDTKNNALELLTDNIVPGENVLSLGGGRYVSTLKGIPEAQAIERAGGKASVYELLPNVERQDVPIGTFITPDKLGKKNYDTALVQNVFGLIPKEDEVVAAALIQDAAKSITKDGELIINVGPQIKKAGQTKKIKDPVSIRDQRKGEIIEGKKRPVDFEETIDDLKPVGPKDSPLDEQGKLITEQITTSLGERDLIRMLMNNFRQVNSEMVKGERIYTARKPIIYTPIKQPKLGNKTRFQKIWQSWKKDFTSNANLPQALLDKFVGKKAIQRGAGKNVEAVWNKLERAIHNRWTNPAGEKFANWTPDDREFGASWLDAALKGLNIPNTTKNARDALPKFLREQIDDMRLTINDLQQTLLDLGYIKNTSEFHTEFISRMGVKDSKGILRATRGKEKDLIELHINRQYEITNPNSNYLKRLYNTPAGLQKIAAARKLFRNELESAQVAEDVLHPLQVKAKDVQVLQSKKDNLTLPFQERQLAKKQYDEIMGGEHSYVDNLVEDFLSKYSSKDLNEIANSFSGSLDEFLRAGKGTGGGSQGVKAIFYGRKNIPGVLRDLMGEYKDPFINYGNTMMKLHQTINNYAFEKEIRNLVNQGKFPGLEVPRVNTFGDEAAPLRLGKGFKNLGEATQLARKMSTNTKTGMPEPGTDLPLENIRAEDIMFDAVQMGNDIAPLMNPGWKQFLKLQALTRISKTAYSFAAQPRNFIGAFLKALAAGNLNIPQFIHTVKVMRGIGKLNDPKLTAQLEKWASLDILGSGAKIGSLREALEETGEQTLLNNNYRMEKAGQYMSTKGAVHQGRRANNFILDVYQSMDDMWKVYSFLNERKRYKQVLIDKRIDPNKVIRSWRTIGGERVEITELDQYAAKMVGRHMDNYGETSRMVKYARRFPAADFLAYKTEQYRTVKNIFKTSFQDMKEGRALLQESKGKRGRAQLIQGYQRFGSIISGIGIPMGIAGGAMWNPEEQDKVIQNIGGIDYILPYSKAEAERETSIPDYAAGDHYMPLGINKDGTKKWLNLTYWDPLGPFRQPLMSAFRATQGGRSFEEAMEKAYKDVGTNLWGNFGPSMLSEAIFAVAFDLDQYGNKITQPGDKMPDKMKDKFFKFMAAFKPNALKEIQRITSTTSSNIPFFKGEGFILPTGEPGALTERGGFPMGRGTTLKRAIGIPEMVTDIQTSLPFKAAPIGIALRDAPAIFKQELKLFKNLSEEDIINSYKKAIDYEYNAMRDLSRLYVAAQASGMKLKDVWKSLTKQGTVPTNFKERDVIAFVRGNYIPKIKILDKDLLGHMRLLYSKGQVRSKIQDVQKELLEIRSSYQGAPLFPPLERTTPKRTFSTDDFIDIRNN